LATPLVIAVSSRALFDLSDAHALFETEGLDAYTRFQMAREDHILQPGMAFPLVQKLLALNQKNAGISVEVILLSRNSGNTGLRIFNSIEHFGLDIARAAFTNGAPPYAYIEAFGADVFLSAHAQDVHAALEAGFAAASILPGRAHADASNTAPAQLRIAFDGDAVIFGDEAERVYTRLSLLMPHQSALPW
jgi:5'-nucleotidase